MLHTAWEGKKVAFLGDSVTDKCHVGTTRNYWQYLEELLGIEPLVYGINGQQWGDIPAQAEKLLAEHGEKVDAICVFAGTNDFYADIPMGAWYHTVPTPVEISGHIMETRQRREFVTDSSCFRGRINTAMAMLKKNFVSRQILLLTPIHRGYAIFSDDNIQPDESFPNALGLYIDDYVQAVKDAGNVWAVPVIDTNSISGLYPREPGQSMYFHDARTDRLHPNAAGHERLGKALAAALPYYFV